MAIPKVTGPDPAEIKLSERQRKELEIIVCKRSNAQGLVLRAKIILLADEGKTATATRRDNNINQHVTAAPDFDALGRGNSGKCSTSHSNGSSNFVLNSR